MGIADNRVTDIGTGTLLKVGLRSFFIQGSFSAKHRQSIGFAFCMEPVLRKCWSDPEEYRKSLIRHSENYNGNPFMATLVFGAVANMERRYRNAEGISEEDIRRFKMIIGPATGSAGDRLFWSTLRPFALLAGIACALAFGFWGAVVFFAVYNIPVLYLKLRWLFAGYRLGPKVVIEIRNDLIDRIEHTLGIAGSVLAGFTAAAIMSVIGFRELSSTTLIIGTGTVFVFSLFLLVRNVPLHLMFFAASLLAVFVGLTMYLL